MPSGVRASGVRNIPTSIRPRFELVQLVSNAQFNDFNVDLRESSMELIDHRRELARVQRRPRVGDANPSKFTSSSSLHDHLRTLSLCKRQLGFEEKQLACLAQDDASARALENPDANDSLERLNVLRQRRLGNAKGCRCFAKAELFGHAQKCPQVFQLQLRVAVMRQIRPVICISAADWWSRGLHAD